MSGTPLNEWYQYSTEENSRWESWILDRGAHLVDRIHIVKRTPTIHTPSEARWAIHVYGQEIEFLPLDKYSLEQVQAYALVSHRLGESK